MTDILAVKSAVKGYAFSRGVCLVASLLQCGAESRYIENPAAVGEVGAVAE